MWLPKTWTWNFLRSILDLKSFILNYAGRQFASYVLTSNFLLTIYTPGAHWLEIFWESNGCRNVLRLWWRKFWNWLASDFYNLFECLVVPECKNFVLSWFCFLNTYLNRIRPYSWKRWNLGSFGLVIYSCL